MTILETLQKYGPMSTAQLWDDIGTMRRASPCPDLPDTVGNLANVMVDLMLKGKVEEKGGLWHVVRRPVKAEPQRSLFG